MWRWFDSLIARWRKKRQYTFYANVGRFLLMGLESMPRKLRIAFPGVYTLSTAGAPGQFVVSGKAAALSRTVVQSSSPLSNLASGFARDLGAYWNTDPQWTQFGNGVNLVPDYITDFSGMTMDTARNRILMFGGGHGTSQETDIRVFDLSTLTWSSLYQSTPASAMINSPANVDTTKGRWISSNQPTARHSYQGCVVRGTKFEMIANNGMPFDLGDTTVDWSQKWGGVTCRYDFSTNAWTFGTLWTNPNGISRSYAQTPVSPWEYQSGCALDPVSNCLVIIGNGSPPGTWLFDPDANTYVTGPTLPSGAGWYATTVVYHTGLDKFYGFYFASSPPTLGPVRVVELTVDCNNFALSTVTELATTGAVPTGVTGYTNCFAYDSVNQVIGGMSGYLTSGDNVFVTFDPVTKVWTQKAIQIETGSTGPARASHRCFVYDPGSGCYIFLENGGSGVPHRTWAYRP